MAYHEHYDKNGNRYFLNDDEERAKNEKDTANRRGCIVSAIVFFAIVLLFQWILGLFNAEIPGWLFVVIILVSLSVGALFTTLK